MMGVPKGASSVNVREIMTVDPVTVHPETSLPDAAQLMRARKIRRLPVVDDRGALVGIVTDRDVKEASPSPATSLSVWELTYLLARTPVRDVMRKTVITLAPEDPVEHAALLMREHKIGGLPVMDQGRVVGIVTESDLFRLFASIMADHPTA